MRINITRFMRILMTSNSREAVVELLDNLKELRDDPGKHSEFFDLYVFGDDTDFRKRAADIAKQNGHIAQQPQGATENAAPHAAPVVENLLTKDKI